MNVTHQPTPVAANALVCIVVTGLRGEPDAGSASPLTDLTYSPVSPGVWEICFRPLQAGTMMFSIDDGGSANSLSVQLRVQ